MVLRRARRCLEGEVFCCVAGVAVMVLWRWVERDAVLLTSYYYTSNIILTTSSD